MDIFKQIKLEQDSAKNRIEKALTPNLGDVISDFKDEIMKAKKAELGEVRTWKGGKFRKEANGWVEVKEGSDNKSSEGGDPEGGSKEPGVSSEEGKPADITEAAKVASETALQNAVKNAKDPKVREAAHREIERRKTEEATEMLKDPQAETGEKGANKESRVKDESQGKTDGEKEDSKKEVGKKEAKISDISSDAIVDKENNIKNLTKMFDGDKFSESPQFKEIIDILEACQSKRNELKEKGYERHGDKAEGAKKMGVSQEEYNKMYNEDINLSNNRYYSEKFARLALSKEGMKPKQIGELLTSTDAKAKKEEEGKKQTQVAKEYSDKINSALDKWMEASLANNNDTDVPESQEIDKYLLALSDIDEGESTVGDKLGEALSYLQPGDKEGIKKMKTRIEKKLEQYKDRINFKEE